jgi:dolichol-phosphate mannosyltransferase
MTLSTTKIAVIIPCYGVKTKILEVIAGLGQEVESIYVVDDACAEKPGDLVRANVEDPRVRVLRHEQNGGVGAACMTGMMAAIADGADILVKIDGDGQMDTALIPILVKPILRGEADYAKGNRFFSPEFVQAMPMRRLIGNSGLSLLSKASSGYWAVVDPTNGFIAIHSSVFALLPHEKIARRFFFESDILFRLNLLRAAVVDVPMRAIYGDEKSNLSIPAVIFPFLLRHMRNMTKRIFYTYFVRDFSIGSLYLVSGVPLVMFGLVFGAYQWLIHAHEQIEASAGTVMLAALPLILGFQLVLSFLAFDIANSPRGSIHPRLLDD